MMEILNMDCVVGMILSYVIVLKFGVVGLLDEIIKIKF